LRIDSVEYGVRMSHVIDDIREQDREKIEKYGPIHESEGVEEE